MSETIAEGKLSISGGRIWAARITSYMQIPQSGTMVPMYGEPVDVTEAIAVILAPLVRKLDATADPTEKSPATPQE